MHSVDIRRFPIRIVNSPATGSRPTREHARIAVRIITRTDIEMTVELDI